MVKLIDSNLWADSALTTLFLNHYKMSVKKWNSFIARLTSVLVLYTRVSGTSILTDMGEPEFGTETEVYQSCSINWQGDLYLIGGQRKKRQVSLVKGCQLTRVSTLSFHLRLGACTNINNEEVVLCFGDSNEKKCWKSSNPEGPFSSISDSLENHWPTRIANDQG